MGRRPVTELPVVDPDGILLWGSPSAHARSGYEAAPMLGTDMFELVYPDDLGYASGRDVPVSVRSRGKFVEFARR